jgi:hypothetical protein
MSAFLYGRLTRSRKEFDPDAIRDLGPLLENLGSPVDQARVGSFIANMNSVNVTGSPREYIDGLTAIIPAEAILFYSIVLPYATTLTNNVDTKTQMLQVTSPPGAIAIVVCSVLVSLVFFLFGRGFAGWTRLDLVRAVFPPIAMLLWLMIQSPSIIYVTFEALDNALSRIIALFLALVVAGLAGALGVKAQQESPAS